MERERQGFDPKHKQMKARNFLGYVLHVPQIWEGWVANYNVTVLVNDQESGCGKISQESRGIIMKKLEATNLEVWKILKNYLSIRI